MTRKVTMASTATDWHKSCKPSAGATHPLAARTAMPGYRFGRSIVPVQFFAPQRQAQIFFSRGVWRSARVMP